MVPVPAVRAQEGPLPNPSQKDAGIRGFGQWEEASGVMGRLLHPKFGVGEEGTAGLSQRC